MNEWGTVKKVIVGIADKARHYNDNKENRCVQFADLELTAEVPQGNYSATIIDEANEDLDNLANIYKEFGADVVRPAYNAKVTNFHYLYCPRDNVLTVDNKIIASPMSTNGRKDEWKGMCDVTNDLSGQTFNDNDYVQECILNKNMLATQNYKPMWDAANVLRAGRNLLYLLSNTGNLAGAVQLQELLGEKTEFKVHVLKEIYTYSHIDSTIALLRPGLALINPQRITDKSKLPKPMQNWDLISCPDPISMDYAGQLPAMSQHTGMNLCSLDENTVIVQATQTNLIKLLEQKGFTVIPIKMRHQRTLGGGPHCCTVELERQYDLDWTFDG